MEQSLKRIVVLYGTKYGSTKRYAQWIAEEVGADIFEISAFDPPFLKHYSTVLFGSPVYMGRIKHISFVKRNWKILCEKKLAIFAVTGVPSNDPRQDKVFRASLPVDIRKKVTYYPLRGAFNYGKLSYIDKILMSGPRIRLQIDWWLKKDEKAREMLARFFSPLDWTDWIAIQPVVSFARQLVQD
ncbi:MAG TPA: flavodoxin domain-containing protein [Syntrophorhabdaceae bacterium]|nr:flavodoxin domain-containing protein [Syntrophorhabdaceae bacterium]